MDTLQLTKLEIKNYRSIEEFWGSDSLDLEGLDCFVGKNNVGKTNIISAIKFLLGEEDKDIDEEIYWNKDTSLRIEVRGFFHVTEKDLERVDEEDREAVRGIMLNEEGVENCVGISRIKEPESENSDGDVSRGIVRPLPVEERLSEEVFSEFHEDQWNRTNEESGFTKTNYRDQMKAQYPEVAEYVPEGKMKNKRSWKDAYDEYISTKPDDLELELQSTDFPDGKKTTITETLLPDTYTVPALKDVDDATNKSAELGEMTDALYSELEEKLDKQLEQQLDNIYGHLESNSTSFESQISRYVKEAFDDYAVEFDFSTIESRQLFQNVDIVLEDSQLDDTFSHENVGEGLRRVLYFSILRTLADIREGDLDVGQEASEETKTENKPLLILYEEAELFLHPNLQKRMLREFRRLCNGQSQIVFNTHSPVLLENRIIDTINIVKDQGGSEVIQFHSVLESRPPQERSKLMDLEKVASYIFSDQVVLVEGPSDKIVLKKWVDNLHSEWILESQNIPVIELGGKGELQKFVDFLGDLGIDCYVMADIGALSKLSGVVENQDLHDSINALKSKATQIAEGESDDAWKDPIVSGSDDLLSERAGVRAGLQEQDILMLMGELEDYYPKEGDKVEAALQFSAEEYSGEQLREYFVEMPDEETTDVETFLESVLEN